ncbi:hypothetical protein N8639_01350 [bacterium]|jgi:hypothetical protein|nr:hypothetical protein [bacterium]
MLDVKKYGRLAELIPDQGLVALDAGTPVDANYAKLAKCSAGELFPETKNLVCAECCVSALWLFNNYLDESHTISQSIHEPIGSYLHGIMHRREGDFSNAKYWFNRAGDIDAVALMTDLMWTEIGLSDVFSDEKRFSPVKFVDVVKAQTLNSSTSSNNGLSELKLEKIAFLELLSVFDWCFVTASDP